jgi:hypothetical protein
MKSDLSAKSMKEKKLPAPSQLGIAKGLIARIKKSKHRRWYYVELYPRDFEEPQYRFVGRLLGGDEKEFVLEDQDGYVYRLRYGNFHSAGGHHETVAGNLRFRTSSGQASGNFWGSSEVRLR